MSAALCRGALAMVLVSGSALGVMMAQPGEPPAEKPVEKPAERPQPQELKVAPPEVKMPEPGAAASLMLDSKVIDFGKVVLTGPPVEKKVTLANLGQADLQITELRGSCQCLTPSINSRSIKPGEEAANVLVATLDHAVNLRVVQADPLL